MTGPEWVGCLETALSGAAKAAFQLLERPAAWLLPKRTNVLLALSNVLPHIECRAVNFQPTVVKQSTYLWLLVRDCFLAVSLIGNELPLEWCRLNLKQQSTCKLV